MKTFKQHLRLCVKCTRLTSSLKFNICATSVSNTNSSYLEYKQIQNFCWHIQQIEIRYCHPFSTLIYIEYKNALADKLHYYEAYSINLIIFKRTEFVKEAAELKLKIS